MRTRSRLEADTKTNTKLYPPSPAESKRTLSGGEPPQPHYGYKAARRPKATYQDCFSTGRDIIIKHLLEVRRQDYKFLAQLLLAIKF